MEGFGLAPIAGYSDYPFREICRKFGADFTFTEMVSVEGLIRNDPKTLTFLPKRTEKNVVLQLFGSNPESFYKTKDFVPEWIETIDINAGCPVKKVIKTGAGAALLKDLERLKDIIFALKDAFKNKIIGVKTRIGFEKDESEKILEELQEAGIDYIIFHARTAKQLYSGKADWNVFLKLSKIKKIPLGASGDIFEYNDFLILKEKFRVDFVLAARGALGKPWIFSNRDINAEEKKKVIKKHLELMIEEYESEGRGVILFRKHLAAYTKNFPGAKEVRKILHKIFSKDDVIRIIEKYIK